MRKRKKIFLIISAIILFPVFLIAVYICFVYLTQQFCQFPKNFSNYSSINLVWQKEVEGEDCQVSFEQNEIILKDCKEQQNNQPYRRYYYRFSSAGELIEKFSIADLGEDKTNFDYQNGYLIARQRFNNQTLVQIYQTKPVKLVYERLFDSPEIKFSASADKIALVTNTQARVVDIKKLQLIKNINLLDYDFYQPQLSDWVNNRLFLKNENTLLIFDPANKEIKIIKSAYNQGPINSYVGLDDGFLLLTNNQRALERFDWQGQVIKLVEFPFSVSNLERYNNKIYVFCKSNSTHQELIKVFDPNLNELKKLSFKNSLWHLYEPRYDILIMAFQKQVKGYNFGLNKTIWRCSHYRFGNLLGTGEYVYLLFRWVPNSSIKESLLDIVKIFDRVKYTPSSSWLIGGIDIQTGKTIKVYRYSLTEVRNLIIWQNKPAGYSLEKIANGNYTILKWFKPVD